MQERHNSIGNALELHVSCINSSTMPFCQPILSLVYDQGLQGISKQSVLMGASIDPSSILMWLMEALLLSTRLEHRTVAQEYDMFWIYNTTGSQYIVWHSQSYAK